MKHILAVEDGKAFSQMLYSILQEALPLTVEMAQSYAETEKLLADNPGRFIAASADLNLPDAPNGEVVDLLIKYGIPTIVFTSSMDKELRQTMWKKGIADYVLKEGKLSLQYLTRAINRLTQNDAVKVLVVDDSPSQRQYLTELLVIHRFEVLNAGNGREALQKLEEHADIRLVITDNYMPEMGGVELTTAIRKIYAPEKLCIIGVSAQSGGDLATHYIKHGANDFVTTPIVREELFCRINNFLDAQDQYRRLVELDREKTKFLGIAAHDIRNPINIIQGIASMMLRTPSPKWSERDIESLNMIQRASLKISGMINNYLDASIIESGKLRMLPVEADLVDLVKERLSWLEKISAQKNIRLSADLPQTSTFKFDPNFISQVIDNLISNAIKYSNEKTTITLKITELDTEVTVTVVDEGNGIDENELQHLFTEYRRGTTMATGGERSAGLGLSIAQHIVEAHAGKIWAESKPGEGSTFSFSLPKPQ